MDFKEGTLSFLIEPGITEEERLVLEKASGGDVQVSEKRGISGETAAWVLAAGFAVQSLPHILAIIKLLGETKRVKRIKYKDCEVENPTSEMIDIFTEKLRSLADDGKSGPVV